MIEGYPFCGKKYEGSIGWLVHRHIDAACSSLVDHVDNLSKEDKSAFEEWVEENNWFEAADGEWDNSEDLNCFTRYDLYQLYWEYSESISQPQ